VCCRIGPGNLNISSLSPNIFLVPKEELQFSKNYALPFHPFHCSLIDQRTLDHTHSKAIPNLEILDSLKKKKKHSQISRRYLLTHELYLHKRMSVHCYGTLLQRVPFTTISRFASSKTMQGALPPNSRDTLLTLPIAPAINFFLTVIEHVNVIFLTCLLVSKESPISETFPILTLLGGIPV